jgi:hypothetical protein
MNLKIRPAQTIHDLQTCARSIENDTKDPVVSAALAAYKKGLDAESKEKLTGAAWHAMRQRYHEMRVYTQAYVNACQELHSEFHKHANAVRKYFTTDQDSLWDEEAIKKDLKTWKTYRDSYKNAMDIANGTTKPTQDDVWWLDCWVSDLGSASAVASHFSTLYDQAKTMVSNLHQKVIAMTEYATATAGMYKELETKFNAIHHEFNEKSTGCEYKDGKWINETLKGDEKKWKLADKEGGGIASKDDNDKGKGKSKSKPKAKGKATVKPSDSGNNTPSSSNTPTPGVVSGGSGSGTGNNVINGQHYTYVSQNPNSPDFKSGIWGNISDYTIEHSCSDACTVMALSFLGINTTPAAVEKRNGGTDVMHWYSNDIDGSNVSVSQGSGNLSSALKHYEDNPNKFAPPIIEIHNNDGGTHYVIVVGKSNNGGYKVIDPWESKGGTHVHSFDGSVYEVVQYSK